MIGLGWPDRLRLAAIGALLVVPAILLFPYRHAGLVSDDFDAILRPPPASIAELLLIERGHSPGDPARYRPLVRASYLAGRAAFGRDAGAHRAVNFALHGANAGLVAILVVLLSRSWVGGLAAGALFAVHPATHENVMWISGRTWPMAAFFYLAALVAIAAALRACRARTGAAVALGCGVLALTSYEGAVTLPAAVAMVALLAREGSLSIRVRQSLVLALPFAALVAGYLLFRMLVLGSTDAGATGAPPVLALANARMLAVRALGCGSCSFGASPGASMSFLVTTAAFVLSTVAAWRAGHGRWWLCGIALAAMAFVPFASFPGYTDRFGYLSVAGVCIALSSGLGPLSSARDRPAGPPHHGRWLARAAATALSLAVVFWARQYRLEARDWVEAGEIAEAIRSQAVNLLPDPPARATLRFFGVPLNHGVALVYITFFTEAMQDAYGRPSLDVRFERGSPPPALAARESTAAPREFIFVWDAPRRSLRLMSGAAWAARADGPRSY